MRGQEDGNAAEKFTCCLWTCGADQKPRQEVMAALRDALNTTLLFKQWQMNTA